MTSTEPVGLDPLTPESGTMIPLLEERLQLDKRQVTTATKIHVTVSEHDETVEAMLNHQDVVVDRVAIGAFVDTAPKVRQEGDVVIVPVFEERLVVEKRLFLTEELRISINKTSHTATETARVRREHAEIEQSILKGTAA